MRDLEKAATGDDLLVDTEEREVRRGKGIAKAKEKANTRGAYP